MNIKLELAIEEVNTILRTLGKHPFEEVISLIQKIKSQGDAQVAASKAAEPKPVETELAQ